MADTFNQRFKFRVPYTNPVYFGKVAGEGHEYRVWDDSLENEQYRTYTQRWHPSDRLSLQFSWENVAVSSDITVTFIVNGAARKTTHYDIDTEGVSGNMYSEFAIRQKNANGTVNGCYCFSQIISQITDDDDEQMLNDGDCLYIEVTDPTNTVWRSNRMSITTDTSDTKLIHYSNTSAKTQYMFDTYFGYMPFGYDLRIEGGFTEFTPNTAASVFQDYNGGYTMISSLPFDTAKLSIGDDGIRIPRYMLRTLNAVFACDRKSVDGIGFEMTGDTLSVDRVPGYANDVYSVVVARSDNRFSYESEGVNIFNASYQPDEPYDISKRDPNVNTGKVTIQSSDEWYIDGLSALGNIVSFERVSGGAGTTTFAYKIAKNYGATELYETITFRSKSSETAIGELVIARRVEPRKGLEYMKIGDTFVIS